MLSSTLTPDTISYLIAGYVVIALTVSLYLVSLALRWQKASQAYRSYQAELEQG